MRRRQANSVMTEGAKVRLLTSVERDENVRIPAGETGTVVEVAPYYVAVRLDKHFPVLDEWDNELQWAYDDLSNYPNEVELVREASMRRARRLPRRRRMADTFEQLLARADQLAAQAAELIENKLHPTLDSMVSDLDEVMDRQDTTGDGVFMWLHNDLGTLSATELHGQLLEMTAVAKKLMEAEQEVAALNTKARELEGTDYDA